MNWKRLSAIGAIAWQPHQPVTRLFLSLCPGSVKSPQVMRFIRSLRRHIRGPVVLLWDRLAADIRDAAFTYVNRLVGLRCMEARELLLVDGEATEVVTLRGPGVYGGRSQLLAAMRETGRAYRDPDGGEERLWRDGLTKAFLAVTEDIRVLFDPEHEFSVLFPTHAVLTGAVSAINAELAVEVYSAPDLLGWVYQFFNAEEKVEIRTRTKGKPGTSHELAVMNQFYTPDWIVKFLVDNTLGRLWLQMHPHTRLYWRNRVGTATPMP